VTQPGGQKFSAEATLSRFTAGRRHFYALVLRNVNDRLEAERRIHKLEAETEYLRDALQQSSGGTQAKASGAAPSQLRIFLEQRHAVSRKNGFAHWAQIAHCLREKFTLPHINFTMWKCRRCQTENWDSTPRCHKCQSTLPRAVELERERLIYLFRRRLSLSTLPPTKEVERKVTTAAPEHQAKLRAGRMLGYPHCTVCNGNVLYLGAALRKRNRFLQGLRTS
jgi:hypothetical protein